MPEKPSMIAPSEQISFWERAFLGAIQEEHRSANFHLDRDRSDWDVNAICEVAADVADEALEFWKAQVEELRR